MKIICTVVSSVAFGFYFLFFRFKKIKNLLIVFSIFNYSLHLEFVKRIMWFCESIVCRFLTSLFNIFSANCFLFQLEIFFFYWGNMFEINIRVMFTFLEFIHF